MISAIVLVRDPSPRGRLDTREVLVRSLVWLVSAVVAGVVKDVTLAGPMNLGLKEIADESGCKIVEGPREADRLSAACRTSKHDRLLIVESGYQPGEGMVGELDRFVQTAGAEATGRLLCIPTSFWQRLFPDRTRTIGFIAPTARCRALYDRDFVELERGLKIRTRLSTRASLIR